MNDQILGIRLSSDFAHFSHPATIYSSLSYIIPPKTTIMGMLGAIMGESEYYFLNEISYSCVILQLKSKQSFCFNGIKSALSELNPKKETNGFKSGRKQFYRELLVEPVYEIYIDISRLKEEKKSKLKELLEARKSLYPLYMGINLCLANYEFLGVFEAQILEEDADINSFVPALSDFILEEDKEYSDCRFATLVNEKREFGSFESFIVETSGKSIKCKNIKHHKINNKRIIFV